MAGELKIGLQGEAVTRVTEDNTALAYGSGGAKVFATPAMIGLMEKAALSSVDPLLEPGQITVGIRVDVEHLAATPVGMEVVARSELVEIDGKRLVFRVEARDEQELIGRGTHERFIVNQERFLSRTAAKLKTTSKSV
ncbi:thioesterase family protein [Desulfofundulus thermosubterraneus]|uniref:Predicted thioesterase n=1 Tax=Desulfofundulus thermosubterraneus DSM 16057 TaxID=1121432 RepID=A0A1M6DYF9_9FIRM|nr:thioesterase family protein [Desulfofundulus thermosubterraneus]SHI78048.1 Predicted thioesterase [Desulfofundulus thermosubterraneus DSM 16057]